MRKKNELSSLMGGLRFGRKQTMKIKGGKRGLALILAAMLAASSVTEVCAVEAGENVAADDSAEEITSVDDANETLQSYDAEETEWEEIYIDSVEGLKALARKCRLDTWSQNKKVYLKDDLNLAGSEFISIPTFGCYFDGQGHTIS